MSDKDRVAAEAILRRRLHTQLLQRAELIGGELVATGFLFGTRPVGHDHRCGRAGEW
ncbi:hypothetical protein [Streptomyces sp. NBC_01546]|uniref:hypothetical protein n=1 Tax=Streptomyces sp. NBC_01546 TaxID=2975872 RepID=UPI0038673BB6